MSRLFLLLLSSLFVSSLPSTSARATLYANSISNIPLLTHSRILPLGIINGSACPKFPEVSQFLGIPFAKPPVGPLRYRPAEMYDTPYTLPALQATTVPAPCGSICTLSTTAKTDDGTTEDISSEDCLYLNIWTPVRSIGARSSLPVRVYIHGGAVNLCSASDDHLNGCSAVARTEMIQVNIQFRRGPFGYFAHPATFQESNSTGNWAFLDQQLALKWVQENIAYFGGDPDNVMINGQSAGAQCVDFHQVAPGSAGLFSSAISQSPACVRLITLEQAYEVSHKFMTMVGCSPLATPEAEVDCMRQAPWSTLMAVSRNVANANFAKIVMCESAEWSSFFHYTLDGTTFPLQPADALAQGEFNKVPYVVGSTLNEGSYFQADIVDYFGSATAPVLPLLLTEMFPGSNHTEVLSLYSTNDVPSVDLTNIWTDLFFTCPITERLAARSKTLTDPLSYLYAWNMTPSCPPELAALGATHGSDLRASFGITTDIPCVGGTCSYNTEELKLSNVLLRAWITTAALKAPQFPSGNPWYSWNNTARLGTQIGISSTMTTSLDPGEKCLKLQKLLKQSTLGGVGGGVSS